MNRLHLSSNFPDTDHVISVTSEQSGSISRPGNRDGSRVLELSLEVRVALGEFSNERLGFEIPDSDSVLSGSAQPVSGRGEGQSVDSFSSVEGVQVLSFREIPESYSSVL